MLLKNPHHESDALIMPDLEWLLASERAKWSEKYKALKAKGDPLASFVTGTNVELLYASAGAGTAKPSFTTEVKINDVAGMGVQAKLPADFWPASKNAITKAIKIQARGLIFSTGTPTFTWTIRGGVADNITAAILLGSAALTTQTGITNQMWELEGDIVLEAMGAPGANSTVRGLGTLFSGGGLASPFGYPLFGGGASPGTVATVDTTIPNFINFNAACSVSNAANSIQLLQLLIFGLN